MSRKRLIPGWLLVLIFVVVPLVEIYVIIQVGQVIGAWWTIALLILDSILGAWLVRREGGRAWRALQQALERGRMPARELADGALILIGGTLMLTPGFVSDAAGILLILPLTRPIARRGLTRVLARRLIVVPGTGQPGPGRPRPWGPESGRPASGGPPSGGPGPGGPVVPGEVVDDS